MKKSFINLSQALLLISLTGLSATHAQNVNWGTGHSYSETSYLSYTSDGEPDTGNITWTLGFFTNSFTPTEENVSEWASYWVTLDETSNANTSDKQWGVSANFSVLGVISSENSNILGSYALSGGSNTGISSGDFVTASGETIWVFAYNDLTQIGTSEGEALLYSYNTTYPYSRSTVGADLSTTNNMEIDVVWGRIDRDYLNIGGFQKGGGYFSHPIPEGVGQIDGAEITGATFEAQLGSWSSVSSYENYSGAISQTSYTSSDLLPSADPESRGVSNALSYALNLPLSGNLDKNQRAKLPRAKRLTADSPMGMSFHMPESPPEDVTYCIMESQDLTSDSWVEIARKTGSSAWSGQAEVSTTANAENLETFVEPVMSDSTRSFLRLDVILSE